MAINSTAYQKLRFNQKHDEWNLVYSDMAPKVRMLDHISTKIMTPEKIVEIFDDEVVLPDPIQVEYFTAKMNTVIFYIILGMLFICVCNFIVSLVIILEVDGRHKRLMKSTSASSHGNLSPLSSDDDASEKMHLKSTSSYLELPASIMNSKLQLSDFKSTSKYTKQEILKTEILIILVNTLLTAIVMPSLCLVYLHYFSDYIPIIVPDSNSALPQINFYYPEQIFSYAGFVEHQFEFNQTFIDNYGQSELEYVYLQEPLKIFNVFTIFFIYANISLITLGIRFTYSKKTYGDEINYLG